MARCFTLPLVALFASSCVSWAIAPLVGKRCVISVSHARVTGVINGHRVSVLLDTGSDFVGVKESCMERLGLKPNPELGQVTLADTTGERCALPLLSLRSLHIGSLELSSTPAVVLPSSGLDADVVVGMPVMATACWLFDESRGLLRVLPADATQQDIAELGYSVSTVIQLAGGMRPRVPVRLNGVFETSLLLDTGAIISSLPSSVALELSLPDGSKVAAQQQSGSGRPRDLTSTPGLLGGAISNTLCLLSVLQVGDHCYNDMVVAANTSGGTVGLDVLSRSPWVLCGSLGQVWQLQRSDR